MITTMKRINRGSIRFMNFIQNYHLHWTATTTSGIWKIHYNVNEVPSTSSHFHFAERNALAHSVFTLLLSYYGRVLTESIFLPNAIHSHVASTSFGKTSTSGYCVPKKSIIPKCSLGTSATLNMESHRPSRRSSATTFT